MKKIFLLGLTAILFAACGGEDDTTQKERIPAEGVPNALTTEPGKNAYDPERGEGIFKDVEVGPINVAKANMGKNIYEMKCQSCHKLTDEKLVGPGWKGVTERKKAEWILNFINNPDAMIDKDPDLQAQLEACLVRMPNQNITEDNAYALYDFMRQNDAK